MILPTHEEYLKTVHRRSYYRRLFPGRLPIGEWPEAIPPPEVIPTGLLNGPEVFTTTNGTTFGTPSQVCRMAQVHPQLTLIRFPSRKRRGSPPHPAVGGLEDRIKKRKSPPSFCVLCGLLSLFHTLLPPFAFAGMYYQSPIILPSLHPKPPTQPRISANH